MKRIVMIFWYGLLPVLGLIWVGGCSSSNSPGSGRWELQAYATPASVHADTGTAVINCFLTYGNDLVVDYPVKFRAASEASSSSNITPISYSSDTSATGTVPKVYYNVNDYGGVQDTIYAVAMDSSQVDTLAMDTVFVPIIASTRSPLEGGSFR